ncbi:hypothetical protein ACFXTO_006061 [Malus domestica]
MAQQGVEELMVHLEKAMDLLSMEQGVKLVGSVLANKPLNRWGVRNILRATWKSYGEIKIKWVKDNIFIITVPDESVAVKILDQVPWRVMKKNFLVNIWPAVLALEEVEVEKVLFWVHIRGVPSLHHLFRECQTVDYRGRDMYGYGRSSKNSQVF